MIMDFVAPIREEPTKIQREVEYYIKTMHHGEREIGF